MPVVVTTVDRLGGIPKRKERGAGRDQIDQRFDRVRQEADRACEEIRAELEGQRDAGGSDREPSPFEQRRIGMAMGVCDQKKTPIRRLFPVDWSLERLRRLSQE